MKFQVELDLESSIWINEQKVRLGFKKKEQVFRKLVRDAMMAEQEFDEAKAAEAQEKFQN